MPQIQINRFLKDNLKYIQEKNNNKNGTDEH